MTKAIRSLLSLLALFLLCSCGYTFQGGGSVLPKDVKTIYIPLVANSSTESGLSSLVTEALRDRFERYGVVAVSEQEGGADAILNAKIVRVRRSTRTTTGKADSALQYDTTMVISAELVRTDGKVLWRNPNLQVARAFGTSSDVVVTSSSDFAQGGLSGSDLAGLDSREIQRGQEANSLEALAEEAARLVYDQAVAPEF